MKEWLIKYWLEVVFGTFTLTLAGAVKILKNKLTKSRAEQESIMSGIRVLLWFELQREYDKWTSLKYIPIHALNAVEEIYIVYHNGLNGNGTGTEMYEELRKLPHTKPAKGERRNEEVYC